MKWHDKTREGYEVRNLQERVTGERSFLVGEILGCDGTWKGDVWKSDGKWSMVGDSPFDLVPANDGDCDWETEANGHKLAFKQADADRRFWMLGCAMLLAVVVMLVVWMGM